MACIGRCVARKEKRGLLFYEKKWRVRLSKGPISSLIAPPPQLVVNRCRKAEEEGHRQVCDAVRSRGRRVWFCNVRFDELCQQLAAVVICMDLTKGDHGMLY